MFISYDRGATWSKVWGSERVTYITSLHWRTANDIIVSSYGRGLWRLKQKLLYDWPKFARYCDFTCVIRPFSLPLSVPSPEQYEQAVMVFGGQIQGARVVDGKVKELFIRPGSSIAFISEQDKAPDIKLTETMRWVGFIGVRNAPKPPREAAMITGLTLHRTGTLAGVVFSKKPLAMHLAEQKAQAQAPNEAEAEESGVGSPESPTAGKPYLEVITGHVAGGNAARPGQTIQLVGRGHRAGNTVEITIDGKPVEKVAVGQDGRFSATLQSPRQLGIHSITIVGQGSARVIDGVMLLVRPEDNDERKEKRDRQENKPR